MPKLPRQAQGSAELVRTETFESALHPRILGRAGTGDSAVWRLFFLTQGGAEISDETSRTEMTGPAILWQPWGPSLRLRIAAGATGSHALFGSGLVTAAIGHKPESPQLRFMADRRVLVTLDQTRDLAGPVARAIETIMAEGMRAHAPATRTLMEAALCIVLVGLWRAQGAPDAGDRSVSMTRRYMGQFTNLVQAHYRERWQVADYARALGITADRLTDICRRARGRTPRQVIAARTGLEARQLLENSVYSLEQIASLLGFPGAAQFSRYFKSLHDVPPGQYRRQTHSRAAGQQSAVLGELHEWP